MQGDTAVESVMAQREARGEMQGDRTREGYHIGHLSLPFSSVL